MIIRIFNFFLAFLLSLNVKHGLRWFRKATRKSALKQKQNEIEDNILPFKRDWTNARHMMKIVELCNRIDISDHVVIMKFHRLKMPTNDWTNVAAALMVLMAVLNITSCSFSTGDSFSWYSLSIVATTCIVLQLHVETNLLSALQDLQTLLFRLLPYRLISRLWGRMCRSYVIPSLRPYLYKLYIKVYGVKVEEALIKDLTQYRTLGDFFCRQLKPDLRPIHNEGQVVSPVNGTVIYSDVVYDGTVHCVKGINYSIQKFLGPLYSRPNDSSNQMYVQKLMMNSQENDLYCSVIYLAAGDYHRFHSPTKWKMLLRRHFAGDLLSVNPRFLSWISDLFVLNERVVLSGLWRHGYFSMTAVGAMNVGSIVVHKDETLHTNLPYALKAAFMDRNFENKDINYVKGDEVGMFKLGSTVVLIYEAPKHAKFHRQEGEKIKYGEQLMSF